MDKIAELQQQLRIAKYEASKQVWLDWYEEGKKFLDSIVGKCFMWKSGDINTNSFLMFKVIGYKTQGMLPVTKHPGYFEVITEGYFQINRATYSPGLRHTNYGEGPFGTFEVIKKKKEKEHVSELEYTKSSLNESCCINDTRVVKLGYYKTEQEDKKNKNDEFEFGAMYLERPRKSVKEELLSLIVYEADENLYNDAKSLANEFGLRTRDLWLKYQKSIEDSLLFRG